MTRRAALVTGASRGIGRGIANRLAVEGFDLTLTARTPEPLDVLARELAASGGDVHAVAGDMSSDDDVDRIVAQHLDLHGRLDVLVLSAGTGTVGPIETTKASRLDKQLDVNLRAPFRMIMRALPALRDAARTDPARGARIIAIASITGLFSEPGMAAYAATKAALVSLCESVNVEASAEGVSASAICPGYVDTDMTEWVRDRIAPESMITVDDVAELAVALTRLSANAVVPHVAVVRPGATLWRA